jgi:mRNA-degrading endonuclease RelE of RelBE toxin-antitoxin system
MPTEFAVKLGPKAKDDLDSLGRFRSRLLFRALHDELRTPDPSLAADPIGSPSNWLALSIGDYRVIYRDEDGGSGEGPVHYVGRIVRRQDLDDVIESGALEAKALVEPAVTAG